MMKNSVSQSALWRILLIFCWLLIQETTSMAASTQLNLIAQGEQIYKRGVLSSGQPLRAVRNGSDVQGEEIACVKCHRVSGMGGLEGNVIVPPISGRFLFSKEEDRPVALLDMRVARSISQKHKPYDLASLSKAIRDGRNISGTEMSPLMPRYKLSTADAKALQAYLQQLSVKLSPGVTEDQVRFATILTPGMQAEEKNVLVNMMQNAFMQRNDSQTPNSGRMRMPLDLIPRQQRNWNLSVWNLMGAPETWGKQLADYYRREPVFAVLSGWSDTTWAPIHQFCEQQQLPCLFPSTANPVQSTEFYSLYLSEGVALEAKVLAKQLLNKDNTKAPKRIIQVARDNVLGQAAVKALQTALQGTNISVESKWLTEDNVAELAKQTSNLSAQDALLLWLAPTDVQLLSKPAPDGSPAITYLSGFMIDDHFDVLSDAWKKSARVVYPYELGEQRKLRTNQLKNWLGIWDLPLINEPLQSEVFFNLLFLTDLTSQMIDNYYRDYLVERAEVLLGQGSNSTVYPRLSLAQGQRFASKGAYLAKIAGDGSLVADSEWIVP